MSMTSVKNGGVAIPAVAAAMLYSTPDRARRDTSGGKARKKDEKPLVDVSVKSLAGRDGAKPDAK